MARKKTKRKAPRKNPKRVAAGRKAAAARWSKKKGSKKKKSKRRKESVGRLDKAIEKVLARKYAISIDGSVHKVAFPGHHKAKGGPRKKRKVSADTLAHLARGRAIRKANLSLSKGIPYGPVYEPKEAGKGSLYAMRMANLAKARAAKAAKAARRGTQEFIGSWI